MPTLLNPKGMTSTSVIDIPDEWSPEWFRRFIRTQLSQADVRNATAGVGVVITGSPVTTATVSISTDVQALFHQPYILASAPSSISGDFDKYRLLQPEGGVLTVADAGPKSFIVVGVAANGIGNTKLRKGAPISVIGNASNAIANVADIASVANGDVLWNNGGTSLAFGPLTFLGTVTTGTWNATPIAAPFGGTGQNSYAVGDLLYASASNALARLADVASGSFLRSGGVGVAPGWSATNYPNSATTGDILYASGPNAYANLPDVSAGSYLRSGGVGAAPVWSTVTLPNAAALGDVMYASAANTYADLAGNATTTKKFLTQTGTGSASAAPGWNTIAASDLPGSFSGLANPSASIGLTVVNGVATTAMRSDATPAISQAIAPAWTGKHTFSPASGRAVDVNGVANQYGVLIAGNSTTGQSFGLNIAAGTNSSDLAVRIQNQTASVDFLKIDGTGVATFGGDVATVGKSGFNNTAPISKPTVTGSKAANAALASLLTALASYGLITDSST